MALLTRHRSSRAGRAVGALAVGTVAAATVLSAAGSSLVVGGTAAARDSGVIRDAAAASGTAAHQSGSRARFWYGTDSNYTAIPAPAPYREPAIGSGYGGYIGMVGNWSNWQHCGGKVVWSKTDASDARANFVSYHLGIGTGAYWFMAGPGVDPHFNGTSKEAVAWGQAQAAAALRALNALRPKVTYPVVFLDVELPGHAPSYTPAPDNGWNAVYTSPCSGRVRRTTIAAQVDRADFNGFAHYLTSHSAYKAGVYSAAPIWASIFGTGHYAAISNIYEWTYLGDTSSLAHVPSGWCLARRSTCAQFFGGLTSASEYALMWQWSGGGGTYNGYGDFDQIDNNRTP